MNRYLKRGLVAAFILALVLIPTCIGLKSLKQKENPKNKVYNSSQQTQKENRSNFVFDSINKVNNLLALKYDSLLKTKIKFIKGRNIIKDSLIFKSDSDCVNGLIILYNECQKIDSINNSIINAEKERIKNDSVSISALKYKINTKQERINRDSTRIVQLNDTLPRVKRKGFFKGFAIGFGSGAAAKQGVDILTKIKP